MGSKKGVPRGNYKLKSIKTKKISCENCGKVYKRKPALLQHMLSKHLNYRVNCPVCVKKFISVSICNRHLRKVHEINTKFDLKLTAITSHTSATTKNGLSFEAHKSFPDMANVITFGHNEKYGKHVVAKCDIKIGTTVMVTNAFASIEYLSSIQSECFECGKMKNVDAFKCSHCPDVWFCSKKCSMSKAHRSKCNKIFHQNDSRDVRLVTEIIKEAFETAEDIQAMISFTRGIIFGDKKSENCLTMYSRYGELLKLKGLAEKEHLSVARRVRQIVISLPQFKSIDSTDFQRIVFYLALRHLSTIQLNAFNEEFRCKKGNLNLFSIYDTLSRFNHSCEPNVKHMIYDDNIIRCKIVRPVKNGDQVSRIQTKFFHVPVFKLNIINVN